MKSEHSAYITLLVRITTLNKGWRPPRWDEKGAKKEEGRKEGQHQERTKRRPSPFAATGQDRWSAIEGPRRQDPSFDPYTPARAHV
ncbi:unnamed protein product [Lasius platythorax]|uniref:Uncharacterized protein n=1 Tax=Lasius platythorax TaxID=488582 RepID=A0AAV2NIZ7_9HYME